MKRDKIQIISATKTRLGFAGYSKQSDKLNDLLVKECMDKYSRPLEDVFDDLIKTLKDAVIQCEEKKANTSDESSIKYWDGAKNAYQCVINSVTREISK